MEKRVLITAAAGGIGAAIARSAKTDGYDVVISDIDTAGGEKLASEIGATFIACNLANEDEVVALVAKTGAVDQARAERVLPDCSCSACQSPVSSAALSQA